MAKSKILIKSKKGRPTWQYKFDYMGHYLATPIENDGTKRSKKIAEKWAYDLLNKKDNTKAISFKIFTENFFTEKCEWYQDKIAENKCISLIVLHDRRKHLENYLLPFFKNHAVQDITISEVKKFKVHLREINSIQTGKTLSTQTICHILISLSLIMKWAEVKEIIINNPVPKSGRPSIQHQKRGILTEEELTKIFPNSIEELTKLWGGFDYALAAFLLADTGARRSEILALQWPQINLDKGYIIIKQAIKAGGKIIGTTKSTKPRAVALRKRSINLLKYWQEKLSPSVGKDFVFPGRDANKPLCPNTLTHIVKRVFRKNLENTDIRMLSTHSFRHTVVSMLRRSVDKEALKYQIGHASDIMQDNYDEFTPAQIIEAYIDQGRIKKE